jgi:hypothetical protein
MKEDNNRDSSESNRKSGSYEKFVIADYEPSPGERKFKDRYAGWIVIGRGRPNDEQGDKSITEEDFNDPVESEGGSADVDPADVYEDWIDDERDNEASDEEQQAEPMNDKTSPDSGSQSTPAERIEQSARGSWAPTRTDSVIGQFTEENVSRSRRQDMNDDQEQLTSSGYITPAQTQFDPTTGPDGDPLPQSAQEKYKKLRRHQEARASEYNDTRNAVTKSRECDRIASVLELSDHQRNILAEIVFGIDMSDFGSFSTSQVVLFAAYALLRSEYKRHNLSYRPGEQRYPSEESSDGSDFDVTSIINLSNHKEEFEQLRKGENKVSPNNAPTITKSTLKEQAKKINELGLIPEPEKRY